MRSWKPRSELFWFLPEGSGLDLDRPGECRTAVQQTLERGGERDVRELVAVLGPGRFREAVRRLLPWLSPRVRSFWESVLDRADAAPAADRQPAPGGSR